MLQATLFVPLMSEETPTIQSFPPGNEFVADKAKLLVPDYDELVGVMRLRDSL